jgi:hypothetical protein
MASNNNKCIGRYKPGRGETTFRGLRAPILILLFQNTSQFVK